MKNKIMAIPFLGFSLCALTAAVFFGATHQYVMFFMCFVMFRITSEMSLTKLAKRVISKIRAIRIVRHKQISYGKA